MATNDLPDITAPPTEDQHIFHNGKEYTTVKEGLAHILIPASAAKTPQTTPRGDNEAQTVFYNPIQQFNRDLSVLAIKAYGEELLERKRNKPKNMHKNAAKKKENKRKRENDGLSDGSRKAGRLEDTTQAAHSEPTNGEVEAHHAPQAESKPEFKNDVKIVEGAIAEAPTAPAVESSVPSAEHPRTKEHPTKPIPTPSQLSFTILDALSATGLRALRYAQEIPFTTSITANDLLPGATKTIEMNVKHNKLEDKIEAITSNAMAHMYNVAHGEFKDQKNSSKPKAKYDVIDLDPYGTAAPFLDGAVQSVQENGGLLCVTCTDAGVWASNGYPEKAFSLYGGIPIKGMHSHEGGLRLILHAISTSAARYGYAMEPLLSLSIDFYARVFVKIHKSPADVKFLAGKTMVVSNCDSGCGAWTTHMVGRNKLSPNKKGNGYFWKHVFSSPPSNNLCSHCGMRTHLAGPMYAGPIHSPEFIKRILKELPKVSKETYQTFDRIEGMLNVALEETLPSLEDDTNSPTATSKTGKYDPAAIDQFPFFFIPSAVAKVIHCVTPHENALRGALRHLGYRVTRSHTKGGSIKTDAPWEVVWEIMREWVKQKAPIKDGAVGKGTAGYKILKLNELESPKADENGPKNGEVMEKERIVVIFDEILGKEKDTKKLVRYQLNPRENWGPMNRACGKA